MIYFSEHFTAVLYYTHYNDPCSLQLPLYNWKRCFFKSLNFSQEHKQNVRPVL